MQSNFVLSLFLPLSFTLPLSLQMHGYDTKEHKWNPNNLAAPPGHPLVNSTHLTGHPMCLSGVPPGADCIREPGGGMPQLANLDSKNGIQLINAGDCSSNHGSVLMNGGTAATNSSNGSAATTLINPLINAGNGSSLLTGLATFEHGDLRRSESVLSALRPDSPSDLSAASD